MSTELPREHPSTYVVQDRNNLEEMDRLDIQDQMLNVGMGGVLPELADPTMLRKVLDVGCGTGGWLMEMATTYPTIEKLVGADISGKMMDYAHRKAEAQQLDKRVQFKTMDALRVLDFPDASFDLVNHRFGVSWLRTWEWTKLLMEYQRVAQAGGIIRITETAISIECNSPALTKLWNIFLETSYNSGRLFANRGDSLISELARLMTQRGIQDVQTRPHTLVFRAGTAEHQSFYDDMAHSYRVALPFFHKWTRVPSDYQQIYDRALQEMQQPDFVASWPILTAWGTKPTNGERLLPMQRR